MTPRYLPLGDTAVLVEGVDAHRILRAFDRAGVPGVLDIVPAYTGVCVHYDPRAFAAGSAAPFEQLCALLHDVLENSAAEVEPVARVVEVPVRYGGDHGPDLADVAQHAGLDPQDVVRLHATADYTVVMIGFAPGFPYLEGMPVELATPRLPAPRERVPAGSVGIAGVQTGIYPLATPGGWRIIGRTEVRLFDVHADPPTLLRAGDRVRLIEVT